MPPFYFFSFIILEIVIHLFLPVFRLNYTPYNYLGIAIIVAGIILNLKSKKTVVNKNTTIIPFQNPSALVIKGAFRYSRNPMYLGMVIVLFGEAFLLKSVGSFLVPFIFIPLITLKFIYAEEKLLETIFKDQYRDYKNKVRRWI